MPNPTPKRGDIWWAALDPTLGSEIKKTRPCLILSTNLINDNRRTIMAVPLSTSTRAHPPITVKVHCQGKSVVAVVDQLRAITKERLKGFIEKAQTEEVDDIVTALATLLEAQ
jgi:mRNA interferase MazF